MATKHAEAETEQRERQARIQQDIRELFARYRQVGSVPVQQPERPRAGRRFARTPKRPTQRAG
jgi:hypothetical protein